MHPHTNAQLLAGALTMAAQLAGNRSGLQHERMMAEIRSSELRHMVDAFVTQRVDAVKEGFAGILGQYAEQARHFMAEQSKYAELELQSADPVRRIELRARVNEIDNELATIRADAQLLYDRMTEVILALGAPSVDFARDLAQPLALPARIVR